MTTETYESKLQKLRDEYLTAPKWRRKTIEYQAMCLKYAIELRDKKQKTNLFT